MIVTQAQCVLLQLVEMWKYAWMRGDMFCLSLNGITLTEGATHILKCCLNTMPQHKYQTDKAVICNLTFVPFL